ncbi:hypothetical protein [Peribacillus butanolivorans]
MSFSLNEEDKIMEFLVQNKSEVEEQLLSEASMSERKLKKSC